MEWYGNDMNVQANNLRSRLYDAVAIWFKNIKAKNNIRSIWFFRFQCNNDAVPLQLLCAESNRTTVKWMKQKREPKVRPRTELETGRSVELLSNGIFSCWCGFPCCVRFTKHCGPLCFRKTTSQLYLGNFLNHVAKISTFPVQTAVCVLTRTTSSHVTDTSHWEWIMSEMVVMV